VVVVVVVVAIVVAVVVVVEVVVEIAAEVVAVEVVIEIVVVAMMMMMMMMVVVVVVVVVKKNTILNSNYKFPFDNSQFDLHISSTILLDFYSRVCLYLFRIIYVPLRLILIFQDLEVEFVSR